MLRDSNASTIALGKILIEIRLSMGSMKRKSIMGMGMHPSEHNLLSMGCKGKPSDPNANHSTV